jgi:S1-C subfamily serine protease
MILSRFLSLLTTFATALGLHAAEPAALEAVVSRLAAENFKERVAAGDELAERATQDLDAVVRALFSEAASRDPEIRFQQDVVLSKIFECVELGAGRPATGVKWARFLYIDDKKMPAAVPMVAAVDKGYEGEKAGLKRGDVVWTVNGKPLPEGDALPFFCALLAETKPGEPLKLGIKGMDFGNTKHRVQKPKKPRKADLTLVQGAPDGKPLREAKDGELDRWKKELLARLAITP